MKTLPKARIFPDPASTKHILAVPVTYLGEIKFADFKLACTRAGAKAELDEQANRVVNRAPLVALPHLITYLRESEIEVELDPALASSIRQQADVARAAATAADERIARINAELATRTNPLTGKPEALLSFQPLGITTLAEHTPGGFCLADDMGLGKTPQSLLSLDPNAPAIVLTRSSVVGEWFKAIKRWTPARVCRAYEGRQGLTFWPEPGQVAVGSYEVIPDTLPPNIPPGLVVIVDEAHNFKGAGTARTRRWKRVRDAILAAGGTIHALTGTPLVNDDLNELWMVLQVAGLGTREFVSKAKFLKLAQSDPQEFARRLKNVMLRRLKIEVLADLPPKTFTSIPYEVTPEVRAELDEALTRIVDLAVARAEEQARKDAVALGAATDADVEQLVATARASARANVNAAIDLVFDGTTRPPFELISRVKSILALAKIGRSLEKLDELEEQSKRTGDTWDSPLLFFSAHVEPARVVGKRPNWALLTGDTPPSERTQLVDAFQAGRFAGMALTSKAGGEGLNLTRADKIVRNDRDWTPAANNQVTDRAWRFGQDSPVQIFDVTGNHPLDERIAERLADKEALIASTVEQAVTRIAEHRESLADRLEGVLDGVQTTNGLAALPGTRREPQTDAERSAIGWARTANDPFLDSLVRAFDRRQELTDNQWRALVSRAADAARAAAPKPAHGAQQEWTRRALLLLARIVPPQGRRIDGPTRLDAPQVAAWAAQARKVGLTQSEWNAARALCTKYWRQVGACP